MIIQNINQAVQQLKRDKHTLLEGYVSEFLFERQFLKDKGLSYTHGWWLGYHNGTPYLFVIKEKLSQIDLDVIRKLSHKYNCWQVYQRLDKWCFQKDNLILPLEQFLQHLHITRKHQALYATSSTTDINRQAKCIEFFSKNNIILATALERNFADDVLTIYFKNILNIDYIVKNKAGGLTAVEVKFKNESYDGFFGINAGEVALFTDLRTLGFKVLHCILYKNRIQKDLSIFEYLAANIEHKWYVAEFNENELIGSAVAPQKTSVDGKKEQTFFKLRKEVVLGSKFQYNLSCQ